MIHFAGPDITVNQRLRQRCAWCGTILVDLDIERVMVQEGTGPPAVWPFPGLVEVDGHVSATVDHDPADPLPDGVCSDFPDDLTGMS